MLICVIKAGMGREGGNGGCPVCVTTPTKAGEFLSRHN